MCQAVNLPIEMLRNSRLSPENIGALALGMAYEGDERPLAQLLQDVGKMPATRAKRVTRELVDLGYVVRERQRGTRGANGQGLGRFLYRYRVYQQIAAEGM